MSHFWFELRYLACAPFTGVLLVLFRILILLRDRTIRPFYIAFGIPFVVLDVIYNILCGSFIFWESPREWLFTTRLKRLDDDGSLPGCIARFKLTLNEIDRGHV
jgi:Na+-transporting NADH:ubiquinone oxidoreductase subunit NqrE